MGSRVENRDTIETKKLLKNSQIPLDKQPSILYNTDIQTTVKLEAVLRLLNSRKPPIIITEV
jgi:hypothetical protein